MENNTIWLESLLTATPQEGFELAIKLSRMGVKSTQPSMPMMLRDLPPHHKLSH